MFDLLPSDAVPQNAELSLDFKEVRDSFRKALRVLPPSGERDGVLDALGRAGNSSLRSKIEYRAGLLPEAIMARLPQLAMVIREGVRCRNHYVHGSEPSFPYNEHFDAVPFFVDTFEFLFGASDLIESGWDIEAWWDTSTVMFHPFSQYRVRYRERLEGLNSLVPIQGTQ
jgi:hypothetical protein